MSIRQTLNEVLAGTKPPAEFLKAVDEYLAQPDTNVAALRALIDAAEQLGLPEEIANTARARLPRADGVVGIGEPTRVADSEDTTEVISPDSTKVDIGDATAVTDDAPTHLRADPVDIDRTVFTGDTDKTELSGDPDRTEMTGADTTVIGGGGDATVQIDGDDPFAMSTSAKKPDELGPGSVLKGRFRLEEVIGQGGMGAVYKAVDLLKVEARDRNPYMAVKLLVGDFKEHPEAFIALQRESAKAQRLAHPNIATVYDFDRDGETVYMTMELMVGVELAKYIKKLPAGGLPVPEAIRIIEQLCSGLQYAHARGLVHSDFKPGNAFLLDDGSVKLLDFGIARASKTKGDAEGESTVFDPGQLGALTPAYATIEMFEGQDPDPRDDIYALAAVSYELFTGKHPFNKMSAVKAKEKNLKPAPVDKLTKRQNRVLLKALALHRDDRCPSVEEFWENLKPRKDYTLQIAGGATAAVLLLGALLYNPVMDFIHEREHDAIVMEIDSGDETRLRTGLEQIAALPPERQPVVAERAREALFAYFTQRAEASIDESQNRYDYPAALAEIDALGRLFVRDSDVLERRQDIEGRQGTLISKLDEDFAAVMARIDEADAQSAARGLAVRTEVLLPNADAVDIPEITAVLKQAQPNHSLLSDIRVTDGYARLADAATARGDWTRAKEILDIGLAYSADAPALGDLSKQVGDELRRQQEATLIATLQQSLRAARPTTIADFRAVNADLQRLRELRPDDPTVRSLEAPLARAYEQELAALSAAGNWAGADALLAEFARALPLDYLIEQRNALTAAQEAAGFTGRGADAAQDVAQRIAALRTLIQDPKFDTEFERALTGQFKDLTARLGRDTAAWDALRAEISNKHIAYAAALVGDNYFRQAVAVLDQGQRFQPELPAYAAARADLATAESVYEAEQLRQREIARIAQATNAMMQQAGNNNPNAAQMFATLKNELGADHPFVTGEGANALVAMYTRLAAAAAEADQPNFTDAVRFVQAGLQQAPSSQTLRDLLPQYQARATRQTMEAAAARVDADGFDTFRRNYNTARQSLPASEQAALERDVVAALRGRIETLDRNNDLIEANGLHDLALALFPNNQRLTSLSVREPPKPSVFAPRITALINERKLTEARTLLAEANRAEPGHAQLRDFAGTLTEREREATGYLTQARQSLAANNRPQAQAQLAQAKQRWADGADILAFERQNFQVTRGATRADDGSTACGTRLAGYGTRANGRCNDVVAPNNRAPQLVVVSGVAGGSPFAISRFEITVEDFNKFCAATGCQSLGGQESLPATGVSVQQIDAYIAWLSEATGMTYRLPTSAEWRHAAAADGRPGTADQFNCLVMGPSGAPIKGNALVNATAGSTNGWGLTNAIGNAQELVRDGGTLQARGGAFQDPLNTCSVDLARAHSGAADNVTGFRVVREGIE